MCIIPGSLKLLPPEELEHLDIPVGEGSTSPVNQVLYMYESDTLGFQKEAISCLDSAQKPQDLIYLLVIKLLIKERKVSRL